MYEFDFSDQVILVAGAGGNLGSAVASKFLSCGASLVLVDYSEQSIQRIFPELIDSDQHLVFQGANINLPSTITQIVDRLMEQYGKIDGLVNTVGGYQGGTPIQDTTTENWDFVFNLNARSVFNLSRAIVPIMKEAQSGKIIHIAARRGLKGAAGEAAYSAAKSAVIRLTESIAQELKFDGVNVNCVIPGTLDTPQNRASMPDADYSRWINPEAIADVILFLASDAARAITGACIPVYGKTG